MGKREQKSKKKEANTCFVLIKPQQPTIHMCLFNNHGISRITPIGIIKIITCWQTMTQYTNRSLPIVSSFTLGLFLPLYPPFFLFLISSISTLFFLIYINLAFFLSSKDLYFLWLMCCLLLNFYIYILSIPFFKNIIFLFNQLLKYFINKWEILLNGQEKIYTNELRQKLFNLHWKFPIHIFVRKHIIKIFTIFEFYN